jgi:hypothetical protein
VAYIKQEGGWGITEGMADFPDRDSTGAALPTLANIKAAMSHVGVETTYNTHTNKPSFMFTDNEKHYSYRDDTAGKRPRFYLMDALAKGGIYLSPRQLDEACRVLDPSAVAKQRRYAQHKHQTCHVSVWGGVAWDGVDRIEPMLDTVMFETDSAAQRQGYRAQLRACLHEMAHMFTWWEDDHDLQVGVGQSKIPLFVKTFPSNPDNDIDLWLHCLTYMSCGCVKNAVYNGPKSLKRWRSHWMVHLAGFSATQEDSFFAYFASNKAGTRLNRTLDLTYFFASGERNFVSPAHGDNVVALPVYRCVVCPREYDVRRKAVDPDDQPYLQGINLQQFWAQIGRERCPTCPPVTTV